MRKTFPEILAEKKNDELRPFPRLSLCSEARALFEIVSLWLWLSTIRKEAPKGKGQPVLNVPGFATDDRWTASLRNFIASIGYHAKGCELGKIGGQVFDLIMPTIRQTERFAEESKHRVTLFGCSLGGYLAREAGSA